MAQIINQYSAVVISFFLLFVSILLYLQKPRKINLLLPGFILLGAVVAWMVLRPTQTPHMDEVDKVQKQIGKGTPVLLEFQSPY